MPGLKGLQATSLPGAGGPVWLRARRHLDREARAVLPPAVAQESHRLGGRDLAAVPHPRGTAKPAACLPSGNTPSPLRATWALSPRATLGETAARELPSPSRQRGVGGGGI